jgi:D-glycero-D-manno-heptose 1,7-bisphosphate phosphatase
LHKAVFLDRDGVVNKAIVINGAPFSPKSMQEVEIIEDVRECIIRLEKLEFQIVVVTNQPDIAREKTSLRQVNEIHDLIKKVTGIKNFFICPHDDRDSCECRKPKSGLLVQAAKLLKIDLARSYVIGDRWKDIEAGQNVGCKCIFINRNYSEKPPKFPYTEVNSLSEATHIIAGAIL